MSASHLVSGQQQKCYFAVDVVAPATDYLAFIKLASIRIWLRAYEFIP
jgi:hypothetical protein